MILQEILCKWTGTKIWLFTNQLYMKNKKDLTKINI